MSEIRESDGGRLQQTPLTPFHATLIYISTGLGAFLSVGGIVWYYQGLLLGILALILSLLQPIQGGWSYTRLAFLTGAYTLQDAFEQIFGRKCQQILNFFQFLASVCLGVGCIYVAATCLKGFFAQIFDYTHNTWISQAFCVIYISILVLPFLFRKQVKTVRAAASILIVSVITFAVVSVIFYFKYHDSISEQHPHQGVFLLPHFSITLVIIKFLFLANSGAFTYGTLTVIHAQRSSSHQQVFYPMVYAGAFITILFAVVSFTSMATFGDLLLHSDTIVKSFYIYSHSLLALMAQLIFTFIATFHAPIFLFNSRESLLYFLSQTLKSYQSSHQRKEEDEETQKLVESNQDQQRYPIMYERVPSWLFYTAAICLSIFVVLLSILLRNVQTYFQILVLPFAVCTTSVFGNLCLVKLNGVKHQKLSTFCLACGISEAVLSFVFAIVDILR